MPEHFSGRAGPQLTPSTLSATHSSTTLGMANASLLKDHFYAQPDDRGWKPIQPYMWRAETSWTNPTRPDLALHSLFPQHVSQYTHTHASPQARSPYVQRGWPTDCRHAEADLHQGRGRTLVLTPPDPTAVPLDLACRTLRLRSLELADQASAFHPTHTSAPEPARLEQRGTLGTPSFRRPSTDNGFPKRNCPPTRSRGWGERGGGTCPRAGQEAGCEARTPPSLRASAPAEGGGQFGDEFDITKCCTKEQEEIATARKSRNTSIF